MVTIADRPELLEAAYPLARDEGYPDLALEGTISIPLDEWLRDEATLPEGSFVALADGEIVGYSGLMAHDNDGVAEDGLTVVRREWRRRGLARALKQRELAWARDAGLREVVTWTQTGNDGMRAVNERLGYESRDVAITMSASSRWSTDPETRGRDPALLRAPDPPLHADVGRHGRLSRSELHLSPLQLVLMGTAMEGAVFLFEIPTGRRRGHVQPPAVADRRLRGHGRHVDTRRRRLGAVADHRLLGSLGPVVHLHERRGGGLDRGRGRRGQGGRVFLRGARVAYVGAVLGLVLQVAIGIAVAPRGRDRRRGDHRRRRAALLPVMPETGFQRQPRAERRSALSELRTTATTGARYAWAAPVILLLIGVQLFMGMSAEAFDRLKEAHFLRDVGLPVVGDLDPVVWFGIFWLVGLLLGFVATSWLIKRFERGGRRVVTSTLFTLTAMEMVAMLVFALTGSTWLAIASLLGVFFARDLAGPLYTIWLNEQITESSVRATVLSISGQANAIGQAAAARCSVRSGTCGASAPRSRPGAS